jgi:hypothetical protein
MCPACFASTAAVIVGVGSTGGVLAICIGKFRDIFGSNHLGLFHRTKEK